MVSIPAVLQFLGLLYYYAVIVQLHFECPLLTVLYRFLFGLSDPILHFLLAEVGLYLGEIVEPLVLVGDFGVVYLVVVYL